MRNHRTHTTGGHGAPAGLPGGEREEPKWGQVAPRASRGMETKLVLVQAALTLFAEQGYEATSISEIAQRAGTSRSALYGYWVSKEALFLAVVEEALAIHLEWLAHQAEQETVAASLSALLASSAWYGREPVTAFYKRLLLFPPPCLAGCIRPRLARFDEQIMAIIIALFERGVARGEIRQARLREAIALYTSLFQGLCLLQAQASSSLERLWRLFWRRVEAEPSLPIWDEMEEDP